MQGIEPLKNKQKQKQKYPSTQRGRSQGIGHHFIDGDQVIAD